MEILGTQINCYNLIAALSEIDSNNKIVEIINEDGIKFRIRTKPIQKEAVWTSPIDI